MAARLESWEDWALALSRWRPIESWGSWKPNLPWWFRLVGWLYPTHVLEGVMNPWEIADVYYKIIRGRFYFFRCEYTDR